MDSRHRLILLGLLVVTAGVYLPSLSAPFAFEDVHQFAPAVWTVPGRAITAWTWTLAATPMAAHALNLALHLVNGLLVALFLTALVDQTIAVLAAGVFLLHPLSSEAVLYATGRGELLVTAFTLLACWISLAWVDRGGLWRGLICALALLGAAMSKEIGLIAVPLVMSTLRLGRGLQPSAEFVLSAMWLAGGVTLGATWSRVSTWMVIVNGQTVFTWPTFAALQLGQVWHLLAMTVTLSGFTIDHDALALSAVWHRAAIVLTVLTASAVLWAWSRRPRLAWALGWIALCVAPRFVFATYEFTKEYQLYPAMVAVACLTGWLLAQVPSFSLTSFRRISAHG